MGKSKQDKQWERKPNYLATNDKEQRRMDSKSRSERSDIDSVWDTTDSGKITFYYSNSTNLLPGITWPEFKNLKSGIISRLYSDFANDKPKVRNAVCPRCRQPLKIDIGVERSAQKTYSWKFTPGEPVQNTEMRDTQVFHVTALSYRCVSCNVTPLLMEIDRDMAEKAAVGESPERFLETMFQSASSLQP